MAKRPAAAKARRTSTPAIAEDAGLKLVRLQLDAEQHRQFRVEAAKEGLSMARMARRLVAEWIAARRSGGR